jgi:hypothetical protein
MSRLFFIFAADRLSIDSFPPIPYITLEQRRAIGNMLTKEQEDVFKLHQNMNRGFGWQF